MVIDVQNQGNKLLTESTFSVEVSNFRAITRLETLATQARGAGIASTSVLPSLPDAWDVSRERNVLIGE